MSKGSFKAKVRVILSLSLLSHHPEQPQGGVRGELAQHPAASLRAHALLAHLRNMLLGAPGHARVKLHAHGAPTRRGQHTAHQHRWSTCWTRCTTQGCVTQSRSTPSGRPSHRWGGTPAPCRQRTAFALSPATRPSCLLLHSPILTLVPAPRVCPQLYITGEFVGEWPPVTCARNASIARAQPSPCAGGAKAPLVTWLLTWLRMHCAGGSDIVEEMMNNGELPKMVSALKN